MPLVTSPVFAAGGQRGAGWPDQILILPKLGLLAVADAPRGGEEGRAGIRIALEALKAHVQRNDDILDRFRRHPVPELRTRVLQIVEEGFSRSAQEVYAYARRRPVLVTLDAVLLLDHEAFVGHVGDGRVYLVRRGLVHQLTVDHSQADEAAVFEQPVRQVQEEVDAGTVTTTVRAFGRQPAVRIETLCMELSVDDRFFVCAAAVHRGLPETVLHTRLANETLDGLAEGLSSSNPRMTVVGAAAQLGTGAPGRPETGQSRLALLAPIPLFDHCSERELRAVAAATRPRRFAVGTTIFRTGDPGLELYLVISGRVRIERDGKPIATLGPGSNFGEMAMLDEPERSADAIAEEECELMVIPRDAFFALLKGNPNLAVKILWNMLLRLSSNLRGTSSQLAVLKGRLEDLQSGDP